MQDFNKAFTQQRNAISAPGLKHGSVMKSNNTHPPPCLPFIFLEINISGNLFSIILFNQALQQKTSQVLICLLLIILTSSFLVFVYSLCDMNQKHNCFFTEKHTNVMVIYNVQTYCKNFLIRNEMKSSCHSERPNAAITTATQLTMCSTDPSPQRADYTWNTSFPFIVHARHIHVRLDG